MFERLKAFARSLLISPVSVPYAAFEQNGHWYAEGPAYRRDWGVGELGEAKAKRDVCTQNLRHFKRIQTNRDAMIYLATKVMIFRNQ